MSSNLSISTHEASRRVPPQRQFHCARGQPAKTCAIGVESQIAPGFLPPLFLSDHTSFWKNGYPAIMVTDTAFQRNPHYHLSGDRENTLNYDFLAEVVLGLQAAVMALG